VYVCMINKRKHRVQEVAVTVCMLFFIGACHLDQVYTGLVLRVSYDRYVLMTATRTYDLQSQCAAFDGCIISVRGCSEGEVHDGMYLDVHKIMEVQQ